MTHLEDVTLILKLSELEYEW